MKVKALLQRRNNEIISVAFWINVSSEGVLDLFPCIKGGLSSYGTWILKLAAYVVSCPILSF